MLIDDFHSLDPLQSINQLINQPSNQPTNQSINESGGSDNLLLFLSCQQFHQYFKSCSRIMDGDKNTLTYAKPKLVSSIPFIVIMKIVK